MMQETALAMEENYVENVEVKPSSLVVKCLACCPESQEDSQCRLPVGDGKR